MKTAREILLERHQRAEAKLKAIRAEDLAAEARAKRQPAPSLAGIVQKFWEETFLPWRRIWRGVGAAWVVILGLSVVSGDASAPAARPSPPNAQMRAALQQQEQLLTQLLGLDVPPPPAHPRSAGPRSAAEPSSDAVTEVGAPHRGAHLRPNEDVSGKRPSRAHLATATGPRAVSGSQQPQTGYDGHHTLSALVPHPTALRAGDGSRSAA